MPRVRIDEIRSWDDKKLREELENAYRELLNLRFRHATRQLVNTSELRKVRKKIAKIKTIMRERELQREIYG